MAAPNAFAPAAPAVTLTVDQAREVIDDATKILEDPQNKAKLEQAKGMAGGDPMMGMMMLIPVAVELLTPVLKKYGFPADQAGLFQLFPAMMMHKEDPDMVAKAQAINAKLIPPELAPLIQTFMQSAAPKKCQ
ncbi:hypothetical protein CYMTET_19970 [Cymbomonas tetramitiformis]|uniref:Protein C10 n=1 Tax=Cymbomonas tetramitiformis TaxID=36881 RepID=A0AAE0L4C5_9CHLO|nr:hypothetical protein CYMTET_19970 [Cymbomonas tetramitiformis]